MRAYDVSNITRFGNELKIMNKNGLELKIKRLLGKINESVKGQIISKVNDYPDSVRTYQRSMILLSIYFLQPTTKNAIVACGFAKNTVFKVLRELQKEELVIEKSKIFLITDSGNKVIFKLLQNPKLYNWFDQLSIINDLIEKPKVHYVNYEISKNF